MKFATLLLGLAIVLASIAAAQVAAPDAFICDSHLVIIGGEGGVRTVRFEFSSSQRHIRIPAFAWDRRYWRELRPSRCC
jgi:hypothetical protein